ncbi:MAG: RNA polymerase sigma factor [Planctomycetes bacterium]|nr:RNA polymerase sigma factor [Planctomycetota bacterium]
MSKVQTAEPDAAFEAYRNEVYTWAYRLLGRHHDALDVAQDVFLRWVDQCASAPPRNPRAWLRRVTIHRAIDFRRSNTRRRIREAISPASPVHVDESKVARDELRNDIANAMEALSEMQQSVLFAKVYDGLTFARIAAELEIAVPTVKTHYLRALCALRDRLGQQWGP